MSTMKKVVVLGVDFKNYYVEISERKTELNGHSLDVATVGIVFASTGLESDVIFATIS